MKTYFKIMVAAIVFGIILAFLFYQNLNRNAKEVFSFNETNKVNVFQIGVFKNKEYAHRLEKKYFSTGTYKEGELYYVIISVTINNKEIIENYLNKKDIQFVIKEEIVDDKKYSKLKEYDRVIKASTKDSVIERINKASVELFLNN